MKTNFLRLKNVCLVKHWCLVFFALSFNIFSQTSPPESISYQGVARDASGNILSNQPIGIQFLIHQGSPSGTVVFSETHSTSTNAVGIFTLAIGSVNTSTFQSIPWNNGPYYLEVQMDPTGGSSYTSIGTQQLLSVPYALYAKSSYTAAGSFSSAISYSTNNAPPISINSNTSTNSTTLTFSQGSNSSSVAINFPPPPPANITMSSSGIASVSPTSGNAFIVDVPPPTLNITPGTNYSVFTITQGTATTTQTLSFPPASVPNVSINATGIVTVTPTSGTAFTIGAPTPTITAGNNVNVTGAYPSYTISSTPTLSIVGGNSLSISNGNTVPLPASNVTLTTAGIATINTTTGSNFNIGVPGPSININNGLSNATITVSQGTATSSDVLIFPPTPITNINFTTTGGVATITPNSGTNFTLNVPPANVSGAYSSNFFTVTVSQGANSSSQTFPFPAWSITSGTTSPGTYTIKVTSGTSSSFTTLNLNNDLSGLFWKIGGNTVTATDYLGTNNAADLIFKTNSIERMRIASNGNIGIGTTAPLDLLHVITPTVFTNNALTVNHNGNNGNSGRFLISSTTNTSDAVYAETQGAGVAVHAKTAGKTALWIENGHIKASITSTTGLTASTTSSLNWPSNPNPGGTFSLTSNDVSGYVYWVPPATFTLSTPPGNWVIGTINFSKPYNSVPHVILTPLVKTSSTVPPHCIDNVTIILLEVTQTYFKYSLLIQASCSSVYPTELGFYYHVIEGN